MNAFNTGPQAANSDDAISNSNSSDRAAASDRRDDSIAREERDINVLLGSYADILFVLMPFTVIGLFKAWQHGIQGFLLGYDLSVAAAILAGLALVKFILGLISDARMSRYRERLVFLVAGTVFVVLVPSLMLSILVLLSADAPRFVMFVQPVLLIAGIMAYSGAVTSTNHLLRHPGA
ncbi:hypothetical protein BTA51_20240 [Hahella sp. CCB-MM4]|uniref:hypothetical protein n=1 Tax=Hahella sp. (strain CCB-MM4) TaxID=1926491 RepID=UPI000B9B7491|nr:hypothetical protein [Hahella sp. CCB-MM4]OZG71611.1 hypothetical protein BTA51_20240 [Hahella sp. CCB-MM4]